MKKNKVIKLTIILLLLSVIVYSNKFTPSSAAKKNELIDKKIYIKGGIYTVGSKREKDNPERKIKIGGFFIDIHPITNSQYIEFVKMSGYKTEGMFNPKEANKNEFFPVTNITYNDAVAYAKFYGKRLPTEWEWEIIAREFKDKIIFKTKHGNFYQSKKNKKVEVFSYPPNKLGVYGLFGNIYEWTSSKYDEKYIFGKYSNKHKVLVIRGGAWTNNSSDIKATTRTPFPADRALNWIGFRCVSDK